MSGFVRNILLATTLVLACMTQPLVANPPNVARVTPSAVVPGKTMTLRVEGDNLTGATVLWTSFPCTVSAVETEGSPVFELKLPKDTQPGVGALRLVTTNGLSAFQLLLVDSLPTVESVRTNHTLKTAQLLSRNTAVEGTSTELCSDFFRVAMKRGETLIMEVVAQRIGSALDPFVRLLDGNGRELAFCEDTPEAGTDVKLSFPCARSGDYFIELRDSRHGGGPRHRYRLRLGKPLPAPLPFLASADVKKLTGQLNPLPVFDEKQGDVAGNDAQAIKLPTVVRGAFDKASDRDVFEFQAKKGDRILFTGATRSLGAPCDLSLQIQSNDGTKVAEANATGADEGALTNRFSADGSYRLVVEELTGAAGPALSYQITAQELQPGFALSTETDRVSGPAGESFELEIKAERRDYDGPIRLMIEGLPPAFALTNNVIAAKTNVTKIKISAPTDLPLGEIIPISIVGSAENGGKTIRERVSTQPALRVAFPMLRHPPRSLDGLVTLSIAGGKSASPKPLEKKRKK